MPGANASSSQRRLPAAAVAIMCLALAACNGRSAEIAARAVGDPLQGAKLVDQQACGSCHMIPGKAGGVGLVGPPLAGFARRSLVAGVLPNTPDNLVRWLRAPQSVVPGNAMPDMGLSPGEARDIAAYLYTLE